MVNFNGVERRSFAERRGMEAWRGEARCGRFVMFHAINKKPEEIILPGCMTFVGLIR
jgi:hypothetical protein